MISLKQFLRNFIWVEIFSVIGLMAAALLLTIAEDHRYENFFTYRIQHADYLPAWFISFMVLSMLNGYYLWKLASIDALLQIPKSQSSGAWRASLPANPLKLWGINLVSIPLILLIFVIIRANRW